MIWFFCKLIIYNLFDDEKKMEKSLLLSFIFEILQ